MKSLLKLALAGACSIAILGLLMHLVTSGLSPAERPSVINVLTKIDLSLIGYFIVIFTVLLFIRAYRYQYLLKLSGEENVPTMGQMVMVTGIRNMTVDLLPARLGELSYVGLLYKAYNTRIASAMSSLSVAIAFDFAALIFIIIGLIANQLFTSAVQGWTIWVFFASIAVCLIAFAMLFYFVPWFNRMLQNRYTTSEAQADEDKKSWFARGLELLDEFSQSLHLIKQANKITQVLLISICIRVLKYFSFYLIFMAVARPSFSSIADLPAAHVIAALIGGEVGASMPVPSIMSFGAYEAGGSLIFYLLGVADKAGTLISLLGTHIVSQAFDYTVGGIFLLIYIMCVKDKKQTKVKRPIFLWGATAVACVCAVGFLLLEMRASLKMGAVFADDVVAVSSIDSESDWYSSSKNQVKDLNGFVVFSSNRGGNHDIYRMNLPDLEVSAITSHPYTEFYPRISPNGERVIFSRSREPYVSQRNWVAWDVYMLDLTTNKETLLSENANFAQWVDDQHVTFTENGTSLVKYNIETKDRETVFAAGTNNSMPKSSLLATPDYNVQTGEVIFAAKQSQIGGKKTGYWGTAIANDDAGVEALHNGCQAFWSPDGNILYQVTSKGPLGNRFIVFDEQKNESILLNLQGEFNHEYFPKFSNQSSHLVFAASRGKKDHEHDLADYELFVWQVGSDPQAATRLTFNSGNDNWPDIYLR